MVSSLLGQNIYGLVEGVLDEGLPFIGSYLEKSTNRLILITDANGLIHYPEMANTRKIGNLFIPIPSFDTLSEFYYDEVNSCLYYNVQYLETIAYIVVKQLPPTEVSHTIFLLSETKLALKCYFYKENSNVNNRDKGNFEIELAEYLFLKSSKDISEIFKLGKNDMYTPHMVVIMEIDAAMGGIDWQVIKKECLINLPSDFISLSWQNYLVFVIPVHFRNKFPETDSDWPWSSNIEKYKEIMETRFNIFISQGIGQIYPLSDLRRSYYEARIALILPKLMGYTAATQRYAELGMFSLLFSQDFDCLKKYCIDTLGPLLKYDDMNTGELLPTLRFLLNNGVNWKSAANSLFIHVNTLHYRINKIEELLNIDFSEMAIRTNLFTAIKVWDTLNKLNNYDNYSIS